jgi:hypothetical protein
MGYEILMMDATETVENADGYGQEGPMTTFFRSEPGRPARLDPWCTRVLSVRTDRIVRIRRDVDARPPRSLSIAN